MNKYLLSTIAATMLPMGLNNASAQPTGAYSYIGSRGKRSGHIASSNGTSLSPNTSINLKQAPAANGELVLNQHSSSLNSGLSKPNTASRKRFKQDSLALVSHVPVNELIIIDAAVPDKHLFYKNLKNNVEIKEINSQQDGLAQLKTILSRYQNLDALHLVSHADDGVIYLGNSRITNQLLKDEVTTLSALDNALKDGADLLLYGCDLAKSQAGEDLLELISSTANIDVAASNDLTGSTQSGSDWDLEIATGNIETDQPFSEIALKDFTTVLAASRTINMSGFPGSPYGYYGTNSYTFDGYTIKVSADRNDGKEFCCSQYDDLRVNSYGTAGMSKIYIYFTNGETFDASSIDLYNGQGATKTFKFTSNLAEDLATSNDLSDQSTQTGIPLTGFTGITRLTIENNNGTDFGFFIMDNLVLSNITAAASNASPTDIILSSASVPQSSGTNATVGTLTTSDADAGDSHTYSLVSGLGDTNNGSFSISGNTLTVNDAAALTAGSYSVRINTNDGTDDFSESFTITVTDDIAPELSSVSIPNTAHKVGDSVTATITVTSDSNDYTTGSGGISGTINGYTLASLSKTNDTTYTAIFTVNDGGTDVAANSDIAVSLTLTDSAGNTSSTFSTAISQSGDAIYANQPEVSLTANTNTIAEDGGVSILTATLSNSLNNQWPVDITANLAYTGTSTAGTDYSKSDNITITSGNSTGTATITGTADVIFDAASDETAIVDISSVSVGTEGTTNQQTITITDAESAPTVTLATGTETLAENGGTSNITASLSTATYADVTVNLGYTGTATAGGTDYNTASASITIPAGSTSADAVTGITSIDDADIEGNETIIIDVASVTGGSAVEATTQQQTISIIDDEDGTAPTISAVSIDNGAHKVGDTVTATITVSSDTDDYTTGSGGISGTINGYTLGSLSKTNDTTYTATFTISDGGTDVAAGSNVPVSFTLNDSAGNTSSTYNTAIIQSSDAIYANLPKVSLTTDTNTIAEDGGVSTLTATMSNSLNNQWPDDITANLAYSGTGTAGTDYSKSDSITIISGNSSGTTTITSTADAIFDAASDETAIVDISSLSVGTEGSISQQTISITDAESAPTITLTTSTNTLAENGGTSIITATLSHATYEDVTVNLDYSGDASSGSDYATPSSAITITAGTLTDDATTGLTGLDDAEGEGDETIVIAVASVNGGGASENGSQQQSVTIVDDEDTTAPMLAAISIPNSDHKVGDTVTATITVSTDTDNYTTGSGGISGTINGYTLSSLSKTNDTTYTATFTVTDGGTDVAASSDIAVNLTLTDSAGNSSTAYTSAISQSSDAIYANQPEVSLTADTNVIDENGGISTLTASLTGSLNNQWPTDINVGLAYGGTATIDTDYTGAASMTISAGNSTATTALTGIADTLYDAASAETIITDISSLSVGSAGTTNQQTISITDAESAPTVTLTTSTDTLAENGGTGTVTATLSHATYEDVIVNLDYSGDASSGSDYATPSSAITISAGTLTDDAETGLTGLDDAEGEGDETIFIAVASVNGGGASENGTQQQSVTIVDDEDTTAPVIASVSIPDSTHKVGDTITTAITVSSDSDDYTTGSGGIAGTINGYTFSNLSKTNDTTYTAIFTVTDGGTDVAAGSDIAVNLTLTDSAGNSSTAYTSAISQSSDAIYANLPEVSLSVDTNVIDEDGGVSTLTASLTGSLNNLWPSDISVGLAYTGTATIDTDYTGAASMTISAGNSTATTALTGVADTLYDAASAETIITDISSLSVGTEGTTNQQIISITDAESAPTVTLTTSTDTLAENGGTGTVTATLSHATYEDVTVNLDYSGDASSGSDYVTPSSAITITAGTLTDDATTGLTGLDDSEGEGDETIVIAVASVNGGGASESGSQQQSVTIVDDEDTTAPVIASVSIPDSTHKVGDTITTAITVSSDSDDYTTGSGGITGTINGYTLSSLSKTNDTTYTATFTVTDGGTDVAAGSDIAVNLTLTDSAGNSSTAYTSAISQSSDAIYANLPEVSLSVDTNVIDEDGGVSTLTASLTGSLNNQWPSDIAVGLAYSGTATINTDYTGAANMTISAGSSSATTALTGIADTLYDAANAETIITDINSLSVGTEGTTNQQTISITDAESAPTVTLTTSTDSLAENGGTGIITATLSHATYEDVTVNLDYSGDATSGSDYSTPSSAITISAGSLTQNTATGLTGLDDAEGEGDETIVIAVASVNGGGASESGSQQQSVTIIDDEDTTAPVLTAVSVPNSAHKVGDTITATITVSTDSDNYTTGSGGLTGTINGYTLSNLAKVSDSQYTTTFTVTDGGTDVAAGSDIAVNLTLTDSAGNSSNAFTSAISQSSDAIYANLPEVSLSADTNVIDEDSGVSTLTATLSGSLNNQWPSDITVGLAYTGTATIDTDYTGSASMTISAGNSTATTALTSISDTLYDAASAETIIADISSLSVGSEGTTNQQTVSITDAESAPTVTLTTSTDTLAENGGTGTVTATLSHATYEDVTVNLDYSGDATSGSDYNTPSSAITITAGTLTDDATTGLTGLDDAEGEGDETIVIAVASVNGGGASENGTQQQSVTIVDDEDTTAPVLTAVSIPNSNHKVGDTVTATISVSSDTDDYTTGNGGLTGTINSYTLSSLSKTNDTTYTATFTVTDGGTDVAASSDIAVNLTLTDSAGNSSTAYTSAISQSSDAIYANQPEVSLTADTNVIDENGGISTLTASLTGSLNNQWPTDINVGLAYGGTATIDTDYTGAASMTISAGNSTATTALTGIADTLYDAANAETIITDISSLSVGSEGTTNQQTISITDAESAPTVTLTTSTDTLAENGGTGTVTATLSHATYEDVTVNLDYSGDASSGSDYATPSSAITISAGTLTDDAETGLTGLDDAEGEGDETIVIAVASVNGGGASENGTQQQSVTIVDDEDTTAPVLAAISIPNSDHKVGDTITATITVSTDSDNYTTGSGGLTGTINGYTLSNLAKVSDSQYTTTFTVTDGGTDVAAGSDIAVNLTLTDSAGNSSTAYTSAISQSSDAIYANLPEVSLTADTNEIDEDGGISTLSASLTNSLNNQWPTDITVGLAYGGTATIDTDYTGAASMTISTGNSTATTAIIGVADTLYDAASAETIIADITSLSIGTEGTTNQQIVSITDAESAPTVTLTTSTDTLAENGGTGTVTATLSHATYETVTVNLDYSGDATSGSDYATPSSAIAIAAGTLTDDATTGLTGLDDAEGEGDETIVIAVASVHGGGASESGTQQQSVTIVDDEDTTAPMLSAISIPNSAHKVGDTVTATITVSTDSDDYTTGSGGISGTINGYALSNLIKASDSQYTVRFTVTDGGTNVDAGSDIAVNLTLTDSAGNSSTAYSSAISQSSDAIYANLPEVSLTADTNVIDEDSGVSTLTASLSGSLNNQWPADITIGLAYTGTATINTDYTGANTLTITSGSSSATTELTGIADTLYDAAIAETIIADISSLSVGSEGTTNQQTVSITDAESAPTVTLTTSTDTLAENGGTGTVTATLSHATYEDVTVNLDYSGDATSGSDYTTPSSAITITAGTLTDDATTGLTGLDDSEGEGDETIVIAVASVNGGGASESGSQQQSVTIVDDEDTTAPVIASVSIPDSTHKVGDTVTATITVSTDSDDYTTSSGGISGTINSYALSNLTKVSDSQYTTTFTVTDSGTDVAAGSDIAVNLTLTDSAGNSSNAFTSAISQSSDAIYANLPEVSLSVDTNVIDEDGGVSTLTASLTGSLNNQWPSDISVGLAYTGTATINTDYTGAAIMTISAGSSSAPTELTGIADTLYDAAIAETIIADISTLSVGSESTTNQQTISITDAESAPTVTLTTSTDTLAENGGTGTVTATLSHATYEDVTVNLDYSGDATIGSDYTTPSSAITISAGTLTDDATTGLTGLDDSEGEGDETIVIAVASVNGGGASESGTQQQSVTIVDDEDTTAPVLTAVSIPNSNHKVGDTVTATISVSSDTDDYTTGNGGLTGTINGYTLSSLSKTNDTTYTATFIVSDGGTDVATSSDVAVSLTLTDSAGNSSTTYTSAISQSSDAIYANLPEVSLSVDTNVIDEDGGISTLTASLIGSLNNQWPTDISVGLAYTGTATIDTDYTGAASMTISAGNSTATTTLTGIADTLYDAANAETIIADISSLSVGSEGTTNQQTISITDAESAPTVTLTTSTDTLAENGGTGTVTATLSHATYEDVTVNLDYSGDASSGSDYNTPSSAITITAGALTNDAATGLTGIDDSEGEGDETIVIAVASVNGGGASESGSQQQSVTIVDDEDTTAPVIASVSIPNSDHTVGDTVTATITVSTDSDDYTTGNGGISGTINGYALSSLSKTNDTTYTATFTVTDGGTDAAAGSDIAVNLTLTDSAGNSSNAYTSAISQSSDAIYANLPEVSLSVDTNVIDEDSGVSTLTASLTGSLNNQWPTDISVGLAYTGTATINTDYTGTASMTISAGNSTATTALTSIADTLYDAAIAETIITDISSLSVGSEGTTNQQTISITDAESAPTVTLTTSTDTLAENGGTGTVTATLSHATYETVTVNLDYSGDATIGSDYATPSSSIIISAGSLAENADTGLTGLEDETGEGDETIVITVASVSGGGASESGTQQQRVTITDNEDITPPSVTSITLVDSPAIGESTVTFRIFFDEDIQGLSTDDFTLTTTDSANATIASVASNSGNSMDIQANDIIGTGSIRLDLIANNDITDIFGNGNNTFGYVAAFNTGDVHNVDRDAPDITSITPADNAKSNDTGVTFTVNFSDHVDNITASGFKLTTASGDATGSVSTVSATSGSSVTVDVSDISGTGSIRLDYNGTNLSDAAGNPVAAFSTGATHYVDLDVPVFSSVDFITDPIRIDNQTSSSFKVVEAEIGTTASYSITSSGGGTAVTGNTTILTSEQTVSNIDLSGLKDGIITLAVKLTDIAGNESPEQYDSVNKDATTAVISSVSIAEGNFKAGDTVTISVTFDDTVSVSGSNIRITLDLGGESKQIPLTSTSNNKLLFSYTVKQGDTESDGLLVEANSIALNGGSILDAGGNDADLSFSLVANNHSLVDTAIPSAPAVNTPTEHTFVNSDEYNITGTHVEEVVAIKLYLDSNNDGIADNSSVIASAQVVTGRWSLTPALTSDSDHNFVVIAEDNAGNRSAPANVFTITEDSTAPVAPSVTHPSEILSTNQNSFEISGTHVEDEISIKLYSDNDNDAIPDDLNTVLASATVGSLNTTEWSLEATLKTNEVNNFVAVAYDKAGNSSPSALIPTIIADSIAPNITVEALTTGDSTPSLIGTIDDPHAEIIVEINGDSYSAKNNGDGTWTLSDDQITALPHGTYTVIVSATDTSGNINTEPVTNDVEIDLEAPTGHSISIEQELIDGSNDKNLIFTLSNAELQAVFTYQISDGTDKIMGSGQVNSSTLQISNVDVSSLSEGTLILMVILSDQSGNHSPVVMDTVAKHYNKAPEVRSITVETDEDVSIKIQPQASDANGDILSFDSVSEPQYGTLTALNNGWLYTPSENFNGSDYFNYKVNDGEVDSNIVEARIDVTPINDAPKAVDDTFTVTQTSTNIYTLDVLVNDSDIDDDQLTIEGVNVSIGGVTIVNNTIQYQADADFVGTVRFEYVISDSAKLRSSASVQLNIEGVPVAQAPVITLPEDITIDANALYTKVDLGVATAQDFSGQMIPVSLVDGITHFPPGEHEVYWQATDSNNARTVANQSVRVHPLISLSKDQTVSEPQQVTVEVILNGVSPDYPVEIPYSVSGDALSNHDHNAQDGVVIIESGTRGEITFDVLAEDEIEMAETITFTLSDKINRGSKHQTNITISEENIAPNVAVTVMQNGEQRQSLSKTEGQVHIIAKITDPNIGDELSYQWDVSDVITIQNEEEEKVEPENENLNATMLKWTFEPTALTAGVYKISLIASDNGAPSLDTKETLYVEIKETLAVLDDQDTDGDLIPDEEEGYADQDKDGIPDYLDAISDCSVVPEQVDTQNHYLVEGDPGVCLRKGSTSVFSELGGLQLTNEEVETLLGKDDDVENIGGIFDYIAYGLPEKGQTYKMVFPQRLPIPANAVYRKYNETSGWTEFVTDADNKLSSTEGSAGYCPPPGDASWQDGLIEGYWCVQLQIKDGGPNDDDGEANGTIVDPGGVGAPINGNNLPLAVADTAKVAFNTSIDIDVLANDSDIDGDSISVVNASANFGQVTINNDNTITYTPDQDHLGSDTIAYSISDNNGGSAYSQVAVTVSQKTHVVITNKSTGGSVTLWWIVSGLGIFALRRRTLISIRNH